MEPNVPRPEYPRPQVVREDWLCLNGTWQFDIDSDDSGLSGGFVERELTREIIVPFCPESVLSGIGETGFMEAVWYRRTVPIPRGWVGRRLILHFQAVDHDTTVWVDGVEVVRHRGAFTPFAADLGIMRDAVDSVTIVVRARDPKSGSQARGKQSDRIENYRAFYTRTTGIWQTVWLEPVPESYLMRPRITPDVSEGALHIEIGIRGRRRSLVLTARLSDESGEVVAVSSRVDPDFNVRLTLIVPEERRRLWSPADPHLYDLSFELVDIDGKAVDSIKSYAGLRSIAIDGKAILLNGEPVFQRLVLDQGYYPDGIMTAPSDIALIRDIELAKAAGFNGARLHQKVFEERFLFHCDRLGYLVWGEFGDWGARTATTSEVQQPTASFVTQWLEVLERDYSHPSIVGWCPLNETAQTLSDRITVLDDVTRGMFLATKASDQTRPVLDASGYSHRVPETDVYDAHNYEQDPGKFSVAMAGLTVGSPFTNGLDELVYEGVAGPFSVAYRGQPYFCSEFGGIWWNPGARPPEGSWGHGQRPSTLQQFYERFESLTALLLGNGDMFGYCYTQLTDVYQEQNGIYRFDRSSKFEVSRVRLAQARIASIESSGNSGHETGESP